MVVADVPSLVVQEAGVVASRRPMGASNRMSMIC